MARVKQSLVFLPLAFACLLCFAACIDSRTIENEGKLVDGSWYTWCIAKPSTDEMKLRVNIEYSCNQAVIDCSSIGENGDCFYPNNLVSHASVVMNLHYRAAGKNTWDCYFDNTALIIEQDPSAGTCSYPV